MLVKIRPYTLEEAKHVSKGIITETSKTSPYSVSAKNTFGDQASPSDMITKKRSCDIYSNSGIILLDMPVPNFFLCGKNLELLKKIMPPDYLTRYRHPKCSMDNITDCTVIYDKKAKQLVDVNKSDLPNIAYDYANYEIGGQVLKRIISEFDAEKELRKEILEVGKKLLAATHSHINRSTLIKENREMLFVENNPDGKFKVIEDYSISVENLPHELRNVLLTEECVNEFKRMLGRNIYDSISNQRMCKLLAIAQNERSKETFNNLVQEFLLVLPLGFRPDTEMGLNLISNAYNRVVKANNSLRSISHQKNQTLSNVINSYKELLKSVKYVTVDYNAITRKSSGEKNFRDIASTLSSKEGDIRSDMQSTVIDNSGRTVIIVDPNMSIDTIGVPYTMLREMLDGHYVASLQREMPAKDKLHKLEQFKSDINFKQTKKWIDAFVVNIPIVDGRQPTLFKFGIQGFKILPVDGSAIILAPLSVAAFNADFDGDQMHCNIPMTEEAVHEILENMMNVKNIYLSRDGSCHMYPRHEIIYGLWTASKAKPNGNVILRSEKLDAVTIEFIQKSIFDDAYPLEDTITIGEYNFSLGQLAVKTCVGVKYADYVIGTKELMKSNKLFTVKKNFKVSDEEEGIFVEDWCIKMLTKIHDSVDGETLFVKAINNYTKIGTAIATNYPPNVSIVNIPSFGREIEEFNREVIKFQHKYDIGIETEAGYRSQYSRVYNKLNSAIKKSLFDKTSSHYLGDENGYVEMARSKCRGNDSTIMQMFGMKGRVMKNSNEAFNAILPNSMSHGLSGLEHYVTAYGGRQGQMDKSIETSKPGYISRVMSISDDGIIINALDCGTTDGMLLTYERLRFYLAKPNLDESVIYASIKSLFEKIVVGRYLIEKTDSYVEARDVDSLFRTYIADIEPHSDLVTVKSGCKLRSPVTCRCQCCIKCYGIDLSTHNRVTMGKGIGFEAAQAIGQPGTQLTMKNFQGGGVVNEGNLTSSFELMQKYLNLTSLNSLVKSGKPIKTDVLSPVEADILETYLNRNLKQVYIKDSATGRLINNNKPIVMYEGIKLKTHVKAGENIQQELGDLDPADVLNCRGVEELIFYVILKLYTIFNREISVDIKHFETVAASMIFYSCKKSNNYFKAGLQYTGVEYMTHKGYNNEDYFVKTVIGVGGVPDASADCLRSILFEDLLDAVGKHILTSPVDECKDPWVRLSLGLMPNVGSTM